MSIFVASNGRKWYNIKDIECESKNPINIKIFYKKIIKLYHLS